MPASTRSLLAAAMMLAGAVAQAQLAPATGAGGRQVRIERDSAAGRVVEKVYEGPFSYVRIETREPGSTPNQHPFAVAPAALRAMLEQAQLAGAKPERLFTPKELDEIAEPLATALGRATPEQDVSIAVNDQFGLMGPLAPRQVTTARLFRRDGQLQLIVGLLRRDFESQFRGTGMLIAFEPGQRAKPVERATKLAVAAGGGNVVRDDWVALATTVAAPATAAPAAAPAAGIAPAAAAPAAAAPAAPARDADTLYRSTADRLRALEKLYKDGLISEAEYQEKRRQILREL